jgi:hypothetical protein
MITTVIPELHDHEIWRVQCVWSEHFHCCSLHFCNAFSLICILNLPFLKSIALSY